MNGYSNPVFMCFEQRWLLEQDFEDFTTLSEGKLCTLFQSKIKGMLISVIYNIKIGVIMVNFRNSVFYLISLQLGVYNAPFASYKKSIRKLS